MDFTSFCYEIFSLLARRFPSQLTKRSDMAAQLKNGGWYFPSSRDKHAYFFDYQWAWRHFLAGVPLTHIVDALEAGYLRQQLERLNADASLSERPLPFALRLQPFNEETKIPAHMPCLIGDRFLLLPQLFDAGRRPSPLVPLSARELSPFLLEEDFWAIFWQKLGEQDPPQLYERGPSHSLRSLSPVSFFSSAPLSPESLYILTTRRIQYGAAALFYPRLLASLAKQLGELYIMIASPHEVLLLPRAGGALLPELLFLGKQLEKAAREEDPDFVCLGYQYTVGGGLIPWQI